MYSSDQTQCLIHSFFAPILMILKVMGDEFQIKYFQISSRRDQLKLNLPFSVHQEMPLSWLCLNFLLVVKYLTISFSAKLSCNLISQPSHIHIALQHFAAAMPYSEKNEGLFVNTALLMKVVYNRKICLFPQNAEFV